MSFIYEVYMNGVDLSQFISQVDALSSQIHQGEWKGKEDALADKVLHLFRSHAPMLHESAPQFKNEQLSRSVIHLIDNLHTLTQTENVTQTAKKLGGLLQEECNWLGSLEDLQTLPSRSRGEVAASVEEFRALIRENVPKAKEAFATWILHSQIPLSKLKLSKEELTSLAPHLQYLNIDTEELSEAEIHALIPQCKQLKKLVLATDQIESTPQLPASLVSFNCSMCQNLKKVARLNEGLVIFNHMSCERLESVPDQLPQSLQSYDCGDCPLLKKYPKLNEGLKYLDLSGNSSQELPSLPSTLEKLSMNDCDNIKKLPDPLPEHLEELDISRSGVEKLPEQFPAGFKTLVMRWCVHLQKRDIPKNIKVIY